jgi:hypothetical protein
LSSYAHGLTGAAIEIIKSLPRTWVLENIQPQAERVLNEGTYEQYRMILRVYSELSPDLTRQLALRAMQSTDPDVREAGEDFLKEMEGEEESKPER